METPSNDNEIPRSELIAKKNDALRRAFTNTPHFRVTQTPGVAHSKYAVQIYQVVAHFSDFEEDNDPYGEHDFGSFEIDGVEYYFKIDYYADDSFTFGAEDPLDENTVRVMTIGRLDEY